MAEENTFTEFIRRIRAGDQQAAADLVREYEPLIRREIRLHLEDRRLGRIFDSMDVCQSVLASFFIRTANGQYDLDRPDQLIRLLATMARNKLASEARKQQRQKRDHRKATSDSGELRQLAGRDDTPSQLVAGKELLERVQTQLSDEEKQLAELRGQDKSWQEIADQMGGSAQARRMQLARALERVARDLGLEEGDE
jgi:RNA polymerase sigma-70 factor (ECF subfamily)